jgi:hypothetical protein
MLWVYYVDGADNFLPKRVPIAGGEPETVFDSALPGADLSPTAKRWSRSKSANPTTS